MRCRRMIFLANIWIKSSECPAFCASVQAATEENALRKPLRIVPKMGSCEDKPILWSNFRGRAGLGRTIS